VEVWRRADGEEDLWEASEENGRAQQQVSDKVFLVRRARDFRSSGISRDTLRALEKNQFLHTREKVHFFFLFAY
jgi:hypothetical protein